MSPPANSANRRMVISSLWLQVAIVTFIAGFAVLLYLAYRIHAEPPPIPGRVVAEDGSTLFTGDDIMAGQNIFQKYGLMQYGTIFGHGAYLGPDFTAQYLHEAANAMVDFHRGQGRDEAEARQLTSNELKRNRFDPQSDLLHYTASQASAFHQLARFYTRYFGPATEQRGLRRPAITDGNEIHRLTAYFAWSAWAAAATRPGTAYSYTNNWPSEPLAANTPTAEAILWSALSLITLLGGTGLMLFVIGRWDLLGWHRADEERPGQRLRFRPPEEVRLAPAQRATAWYFLVIAGLFLLQGLLGATNAHYHVEPGGFYGLNLSQLLPYNLSRMWHVQLALFFVAASYLAMGIFLAPMIARREPKHQDKLALILFGALVVVVVGSLLGEAASIKGIIPTSGPWFWIGTQGWTYVDLGRLWQILLTLGMFFWVVILVRGLWNRLPGEHPGNLPYLFLYSALSIPLFYAVGMVFGKNVNFAVMDFWRFWVVHLWVEDFLELFTTIMVAYIYVLLGVVRPATAARVVYLDIILYSIGGVIGTMHHLYFSGAPAIHMAMGAVFSAMEVIPLVLLTFEAWRFMRLGAQDRARSVLGTSAADFPHKWADDVPHRRGLLELPGRRGVRLPHQPAHRELLRDRHRLHGQSRPRGADGRLRHVGHRLLHVHCPTLHSTRPRFRAGNEALVLGPECRPGIDALRQSDSAGRAATLRCRPLRLLARQAAGVLPAAVVPPHRVVSDARRLDLPLRRYSAGGLPGAAHVRRAAALCETSGGDHHRRVHAVVRGGMNNR